VQRKNLYALHKVYLCVYKYFPNSQHEIVTSALQGCYINYHMTTQFLWHQ